MHQGTLEGDGRDGRLVLEDLPQHDAEAEDVDLRLTGYKRRPCPKRSGLAQNVHVFPHMGGLQRSANPSHTATMGRV